jgi:hypothetical protein
MMAADRFYGEFYDFYSVSPEYLGYSLIYQTLCAISVGRVTRKKCVYLPQAPSTERQVLTEYFRDGSQT